MRTQEHKEKIADLVSKVDNAYSGWLTAIKGADRSFLTTDNASIQSDSEAISLMEQQLTNAIVALANSKDLSEKERNRINDINLTIARYRSDKVKGISNAHFKSYEESTDILTGMLSQKIKFPKRPEQEDVLKALPT